MILISRAPVRISFGGGGTDLPSYFEDHGGFVVSATINYYVYTILTPSEPGVRIISADYRAFEKRPTYEDLIWDGDLSLPKAITYYFNVCGGVTVFLASQIPPGTGLGSSGSVAVSMIKALAFWVGLDLNPKEVAELSCYIEIDKMGMPVGKQDQYAAAYGGINAISFEKNGVSVTSLKVSDSTRTALNENLLLFYTGSSRRSSTILREQQKASKNGKPEIIRRLNTIKTLARDTCTALERGDLQAFSALMHESWLQKRGLAEGVTNPFLDNCYETALAHGALGGKITGAGGGGFLLLYCPSEQQEDVTQALQALGLQRRPFQIEEEGVQVLQAYPWQLGQMPGVQSMASMGTQQMNAQRGMSYANEGWSSQLGFDRR